MMKNNLISQYLIDYYFGTIDDEKRIEVEQLLAKNSVVLSEYMTLKRELEVEADEELIPSPLLKQRLDKELFETDSINWSHKIVNFFTVPRLVTATIAVTLISVFSFQLINKNNDQRDSAQISGITLDTSSFVSASIDVL